MKSFIRFTLVVLFLGINLLTAHAAFTSLYVFGDTLSATADPESPGLPYFYGQRDSNGRVWVEVLAQRQGLTLYAANNDSYFDHSSSNLVTELQNFTPPQDIATSLFIVWVCNADTFDAVVAMNQNSPSNSIFAAFQAANSRAQINHLKIITTLYAQGLRNLILPNAVDISLIPAFNAGTKFTGVEHAGCMDYNLQFANMINQARALCPGLNIYTPDYFTLLNNVITNAAYYGLTNALSPKGFSIDAYSDSSIKNLTLNGQGTNYIFWDPQDPTAKFHEIIGDVAQQIISPVQISQLTVLNGNNQLTVANLPLGLSGFVDGITTTNQTPSNWTALQSFDSLKPTQSLSVISPQFPPFVIYTNTSSGPISIDPNNPSTNSAPYTPQISQAQIYRLRFPYAWVWP